MATLQQPIGTPGTMQPIPEHVIQATDRMLAQIRTRIAGGLDYSGTPHNPAPTTQSTISSGPSDLVRMLDSNTGF